MIHNILISFPNQNLDVDLNLKEVKGDTIVLNVTVDDIDLSNYKIRCELTDDAQSIQLGNEEIVGSNPDITAVEAESGMSGFQVVVPAGRTTDFKHYGTLEIEIEDEFGFIFTILQQRVTFLEENIDWQNPA